MGFLACPLCGRNVSLDHFDPSGFELDVTTQDIVGLGRGKGFRTEGRSSILGNNPVVHMIIDRIIALLNLFMDEDIVTWEEVSRRLGYTPDEEPAVEYEADETQALRENEELRNQSLEELCTEAADVLGEVPEDYVNEGDDDSGDELVGKLRYYVRRVLDEYTAMRENQSGGDN